MIGAILVCVALVVFVVSKLSSGSPIRLGPSRVAVSQLRADSINLDRQRIFVRGYVVGRSGEEGGIEFLVISDKPTVSSHYPSPSTIKVMPAPNSLKRGDVVEFDAYFDGIQTLLRATSAEKVGEFQVPEIFGEDGSVLVGF